MLLQDTGSPAYPDWLALAIVFTLLLPLLSSRTVRYQPIWYISLIAAIDALFSLPNTKLKIFVILFLFRYVRLIVNLTAFCLYKPVAVPTHPSLTAKDVTVIVPTVAPYGKDFEECIQSIQANGPAKIVIVTAGPGNYEKAIQSVDMSSNILIKHCHVQNKRAQVCEALEDEVREERENDGVYYTGVVYHTEIVYHTGVVYHRSCLLHKNCLPHRSCILHWSCLPQEVSTTLGLSTTGGVYHTEAVYHRSCLLHWSCLPQEVSTSLELSTALELSTTGGVYFTGVVYHRGCLLH